MTRIYSNRFVEIKKEDYPKILNDYCKYKQKIYSAESEIGYNVITEKEIIERIKTWFEEDINKLYFLYIRNIIAGELFLVIKDNIVHIRLISISPDNRGEGYSKLLLQKTVEIAKKYKCLSIELFTEKENTIAQSLYEKFGFSKIDKGSNNIRIKYSLEV